MLKGKRVPLSGGSWLKGDVLTDEYVIEVKARTYKTNKIWVNPKWIEQVLEEAKFMGKKPLLVVYDRTTKNYWIIEISEECCEKEKHSFGFLDYELCIQGKVCHVSKFPKYQRKRNR